MDSSTETNLLDTWEGQVDFVRSMPEPAAKILWILFLSGRSLTAKQLQFTCNMAERTIANGLEWLAFKSLVQNNGKFNGWSLTAVAYHLPLPFSQLTTGHQNALTAPPDEAGESSGHDSEIAENRKIYGFENGENRKKSGFLSSSSYSNTSEGEKEKEEEETRENRKIYGFVPDEQSTAVRNLLIAAGVGPRSVKLTQLCALGLDADFVAAHVHVWQVRVSEPLGYLITRLQSGEAPSVCKCPDCRTQIPAEYADIVLR